MTVTPDLRNAGESYAALRAFCTDFMQEQDLGLLDKAWDFASRTFGTKKTDGDEPILEHVVSIARVAAEDMGLGINALAACLIHDAILKGFVTEEQVRSEFGETIAMLLTGFTRISELPTEKVTLQSDSFRKLFLALIDDIRVILIKLAHRLYDMRNIDSLPEAKQTRFHNEVVHLYSPIAHRLGLYRIKKELEDLSMKYLQPEIYGQIENKIRETEEKRNVFIGKFSRPIEEELTRQGLSFEIKGRPKSIPSIWNKMEKQEVEFEQIFDLFAIRIILDSTAQLEKADCWKAYSIVTNIYQPNPKRLRDWISTPKASGYESLHTTVKGPNDRWVEVQIRSRRMDEVAEKGQAAHWKYKGFGSKKDTEEWLSQVRDIIEHPEQINFEDFDNVALKKTANKVYVFTPTGDLKELQAGATVLDFAFEVHTSVGCACTGARVNNKLVPIKQVLNNGDKVEIVTSKMQRPKIDWLSFVVTNKAIGKIKRALREDKFQESEKGNELLRRKFRNWKIPFKDENIDKLIKKYKLGSSVDLYSLIYQEKIDLLEIKKILKEPEPKAGDKVLAMPADDKKKQDDLAREKLSGDILLIDRRLDKVNYKLARCCNPIPGDDVFGFITISRGITIHRRNCPNARQLLNRYGYRRIDVQWKESDEGMAFQAMIRVTGMDRIGIMNDISQVISNDIKANMLSLKIEARNGIFTGNIKIIVKSAGHLDELLSKLSRIKGVNKSQRVD